MRRIWGHITGILIGCMLVIAVPAYFIYRIDPFFHYRKPDPSYYYERSSTLERYYNDGIARHFDYDAVVTGVSTSDQFQVREVNALWDVNAVKIIYSGGTLKEIGNGLKAVAESPNDVRLVIASLDVFKLMQEKDHYRPDVESPTYLYDKNPLNDVSYLFNKDVFFNHCYTMMREKANGRTGGVAPFDNESVDPTKYELSDGSWVKKDLETGDYPERQEGLTETEREQTLGNVRQNIIDIVQANPEIEFYYFCPPYSIVYWANQSQAGMLRKVLEAEELALELLSDCDNVCLFSWNDNAGLIADVTQYGDQIHYGYWINHDILVWMKDGEGQLDKEGLDGYLEREHALLLNYDYQKLAADSF